MVYGITNGALNIVVYNYSLSLLQNTYIGSLCWYNLIMSLHPKGMPMVPTLYTPRLQIPLIMHENIAAKYGFGQKSFIILVPEFRAVR